MSTISEAQFRTICDEVFRDRQQVYDFNPQFSHADAALWVVIGSLYSLLDLAPSDVPVTPELSTATQIDTIVELLEPRRGNDFDVRAILTGLIDKLEGEE